MPVPKLIEDAVTSLLGDELKKRKVKALPLSILTPVGLRKPDLYCKNAGVYVIEAKFTEKEFIDAIAKVQNDYLKFHKDLGIKGGFALLYPQELSRPMPIEVAEDLAYKLRFKVVSQFPPEDIRKSFTVYEGSLSEIADILARHILTPPEYVEPKVDYIIKALRDSVIYITIALKHMTGSQLEDLFGGKSVFRNIPQYEEKAYPVEDLRLASAYLLVNQLLFYHVLARLRPSEFSEIDADRLRQPADLNSYFRRVLDVNYEAIFRYNVAERIPARFLENVKLIINVIAGLSPEKVGSDLLGTIFHDLVPFDVRKSIAAFYTNVVATEMLANLAIDRSDAKVADLAVGSGGLLVASYRRKKQLLEKEKGEFTQEDHRRFVEEDLVGIDVMPFAAGVATSHLALQSPQYFTRKANIAIWDSTELRPGMTIPSIAELRAVLRGQTELEAFITPSPEVKGVVALREGEEPEKITLNTYDVVIMNPLFTRQERIPQDYKRKLDERFEDYKPYLHGQLGYYGYFIMLADTFLKEGGRMALVLPATVLRVKSCEGLRKLWSERYHIEHIITTWRRPAFSESVRFREVLLVACKSKLNGGAKTTITVLKELPKTLAEAREVAEMIKRSKNDWENDRIAIRVHDYSKLKSDISNWFKYVAVSDLSLTNLMEKLLKHDKFVPLSTMVEAQRIDLEHLKYKDFHGFILYDKLRAQKRIDLWIFDRIEDDVLVTRHKDLGWDARAPLDALGRGLRKMSYVNTMDISKTSDYLILSWFNGIKDMAKTILSDKEFVGLKESAIEAWRDKFNDRSSHLLLARRFDLLAPGTALLAFYSDEPVVGIDMWCIRQVYGGRAKVLALWLNSTLNLLQTLILRTETRGAWMKIHDYMLSEIVAPDFNSLSGEEIKLLLGVFESVKDVRFPSILKQLKEKHPSRRLVDEAWLKILGYGGDIDAFLDKLYDLLVNEIELLRKLMAEGVKEAMYVGVV